MTTRTSTKTALALLAVSALTVPAAAEWSMFGSFEPSTPYDDRTWMHADPPLAGEQKVYFNAISGSHYPPASTLGKPYVNPNLGLLQSQIEPFGLEYHVAFLGVWTDCNGDGYVGAAEGALREYASSLLLDDSICPASEGPAETWNGANNYNGWVSEFIPIVRGTSVADARVHRDASVRIWGDFHRPDERPFHRSCALYPFPRGTWQTTGGAVNYADCRVDLLGPWNQVMTRIGDPLDLRFSDADDATTGRLGQISPFGTEDTSRSPAYVYDCSADPTLHSGSTYNATPLAGVQPMPAATNVTVWGINPRLNPANPSTWTVPALVNHTIEGTPGIRASADCNTSNDRGADFYGFVLQEADFNGVNPNNKREADWNFGLITQFRGKFVNNSAAAMPLFAGEAGAPNDLGVGIGGTRYVGDSTWASKAGPRSVRADLDNGGVAIAPAYWLTFYARLGPDTLAGFDVPRADGIYGSWHCGAHTSGIHNGWNCDENVWYQNPDGSFPNDPNQLLAKPGWSYHLRDVDCYDGRIGDTGMGIQPAFYGVEPCP